MTNTSFSGHVIASFKTMHEADSFFDALKNLNYTDKEISVFMSKATKDRFADSDLDQWKSIWQAAASWSVAGGALWAILWLILGLWSNAVIPGLGLVVAGPLIWALAWAWAGGGAWTLIWAIAWLWIHKDYAKKFKDEIEEGHVVIAVDPRLWDIDTIKDLADEYDCNQLYDPSK